MCNVAADDLPLLQVHLFELIDLINGGRKQGLLHEKQVVVGLDPHDGIDDFLQARRLHVRGTERHPIPLPIKLVGCKARDDARLLIQNAAAIEHRSRQHRPHLFARGQRLRRKQNIQLAHFRPQGLKRKLVVGERQRTERHCRRGQVPDLVTIVLGMRLPNENQPLAVLEFLDAVAERFPQHHIVRRYAKRRQAGLKFLSAHLALRRRILHAKRLVMHVRGRP